jgi:CheY-like chemotaxis protein
MSNERILVVDDHPTNRKLICDLLGWFGYAVSQATDAEKALDAVREGKPHLILLDIGLPGMDGLTLARQLKADEATRDIRILALTAFAMKGDEQRALAAGCDGYVAKPINTRGFPEQVAKCLRGERVLP